MSPPISNATQGKRVAPLVPAPAGRAPAPAALLAREPRSATSPNSVILLAIGALAGVYSGLFGIGAGTIIVPLLVLRLGCGERVAVGTSQAAIA
jgi:uncharacterized membrane protein YfcA